MFDKRFISPGRPLKTLPRKSTTTRRILILTSEHVLALILDLSPALEQSRQADLRLGETCAVIGLGLLGQITALLLKASGVQVVGIDIDEATLEAARGGEYRGERLKEVPSPLLK
ncbi:MAG: hypothetical protein HGA22_09910, partial [Clostridiales bacterium]|nr:hypothetical protein [Clostridiales bacterium]